MTKKEELVWRLGKLPTVEEITTLIDKKIITQEEAREILFNKKVEEERDVKSLESEIKFLRELVEKLSKDRAQIIREIEVIKPIYIKEPWYQPYYYWCGNGTITVGTAIGTTNCTVSNSAVSTQNSFTPTSNFSSIQTW